MVFVSPRRARVPARDRVVAIDAYLDARFDSSWDRNHGFVTKQVMCAPIVDEEGALLGIIQAINKDGGAAAFSEDDERLVRMLAKHIEIFIAKM